MPANKASMTGLGALFGYYDSPQAENYAKAGIPDVFWRTGTGWLRNDDPSSRLVARIIDMETGDIISHL